MLHVYRSNTFELNRIVFIKLWYPQPAVTTPLLKLVTELAQSRYTYLFIYAQINMICIHVYVV
jgi:hypothetical protein